MSIFSEPADNGAILQAIFDRDVHAVACLRNDCDAYEGKGRLLRTAVLYSTPEIVELLRAITPQKFYPAIVQEGLQNNKVAGVERLIPATKFSNGAHDAIALAFEKEQWECLMPLLLHADMKRDGHQWVARITKRTPTEVATRLERLMGARLCRKLPVSIWTLAGNNPQSFKVFAPHLDLKKMYEVVLTKMYTRLTKDSQDLIETLLLEQGHRVAV